MPSTQAGSPGDIPLVRLVGDDVTAPCIDGVDRRVVDLDAAATTSAFPSVADTVAGFMPWYSSVHRGAGAKSRRSSTAYEDARGAVLSFASGTEGGVPTRREGDVAIFCRNTTEAINHLAYRLDLSPDDVVVTTVVDHHANLLPWGRVATRRYVECDRDGTFSAADVRAALRAEPRPRLLAVTGASNVTGWLPPLDEILADAHAEGIPVLVDAAQLAPHRPLPAEADFVAFSGHKLYAPYGAGALVGPRSVFEEGDPFLAGGGAVDLVDLDEVVWTAPPEREEAGSPNVVGAVALHAAIDELGRLGWDAIIAHERALAHRLRGGLAAIDGVRLLGPPVSGPGGEEGPETLAVAAFTVTGVHHALVAARLSAEWGIGVRHGCFCAHPYLVRLLGLSGGEVERFRSQVLEGDHSSMPGAVRASASLATTAADIDSLLEAVAAIAGGLRPPVPYEQDPRTGDFWPVTDRPGWTAEERGPGASCAQG